MIGNRSEGWKDSEKKNRADRNEKRQRVTTGTERIPRVETQAAGCFGTYRRIQFEERESRGVAKHALYRETPRRGRRTDDYFLLVRRSLRGWFPVREDFLGKRRRTLKRR